VFAYSPEILAKNCRKNEQFEDANFPALYRPARTRIGTKFALIKCAI
jgi:hypothetical protein